METVVQSSYTFDDAFKCYYTYEQDMTHRCVLKLITLHISFRKEIRTNVRKKSRSQKTVVSGAHVKMQYDVTCVLNIMQYRSH